MILTKSSSILFAAIAATTTSTMLSVSLVTAESDPALTQRRVRFVDPALTQQRIVGGEQSAIGDYPYFGKYNTIFYSTKCK